MDYAMIGATFESFNVVRKLLGVVYAAKVDADAKEKINEALTRLGETQDGMFQIREELNRLQNERDDLRKQLDAADYWLKRSAQYSLAEAPGGAFVYQSSESPHHYACPSCFNKKEIHPLQDNRTLSGKFRCTGCKAEYPVNPQGRISPEPVRSFWP
ncbi:hypothetical protein [Pseudomonas sp. R37(2017)]|uniref:hypothetical protein n=1 Tax=Pseudomonas sp. R37(2017) TaxID=1981685 RepID=UPI000A1F0C02|nr:hypothetical protein [Pseudomonas sp. R37(2017)]